MIQEVSKPFMQTSQKVNSIPEALSIYINQLVYSQKRKGLDITTLSLGEAYFDMPLFDFNKLDLSKCYHYSESLGIPELRQKICEYYKSQYQAQVDYEKEILISAGSKPLIFMAMQAVLNEGDEVLIHEPAWLSYKEQIKLTGAIPKFIPYDCTVDNFNQYFTDKTKLVVINNPNNPAGWHYSRESLSLLYDQCRPKGIYLLADEAYSDFIEQNQFCSLVNLVQDKDGIIVINSLSKNMGISGWRIGYVISTPEVIQNILKLNQHLITCASTILLQYMARYFDDIKQITLPQAHDIVRKRKLIKDYMDQIGIKALPGASTIYFFINIEDFPGTSLDFSLFLLFKYNIATVPGMAYGQSTGRFVRISIGTESEERIIRSLDLIKELIHSAECDGDFITMQLKKNGFKSFEVEKC